MSSDHTQPSTPSDETLIRLAADGELSEGLSSALDALRARDPHTDDRIAHERRLRDAVAGALAENTAAPAGLRDRVAKAMANVPDAEIEGASPAPATAVVTTPAGDTRDRGFWARVPALLAVAATLALVASVLIVASNTSSPLYENRELGAQLVGFFEGEHTSCAEFESHFNAKMFARSIDQARELANNYLGASVNVLSINQDTWDDAHLEFMGFGPCAVPGASRSGHMIFRSTDEPSLTVSLFVHRDEGRLNFDDGECCFVTNPASEGDGRIVAWRSEGIVYYLYSQSEQSMRAAREAMGTPENELRLL